MRGCALGYGSLNLTLLTSPSPSISPYLSSPCRFHGLVRSSWVPLSLPQTKRAYINGNFRALTFNCGSSSSSSIPSASRVPAVDDGSDFIVVNLYQFVFINDPEFEVDRHLFFLEELDIHGRTYINEQGINAQFSGPSRDALAYVKWLRQDPRFSNILVQVSPSSTGLAFPRLKLRYKPSLVQEFKIFHCLTLQCVQRPTPITSRVVEEIKFAKLQY